MQTIKSGGTDRNHEAQKRTSRLFKGVSGSLRDTDPEWVDIVADCSPSEVVSANKLTEKELILCILPALLGFQEMGAFQNMLHAALHIGVDPIAIREIIYQATSYLGIGRTYDFLITANEIMEQHGVKLPLAPTVDNDKEKLCSVVEQRMLYIGYPRALNAMHMIDEVAGKMECQQT